MAYKLGSKAGTKYKFGEVAKFIEGEPEKKTKTHKGENTIEYTNEDRLTTKPGRVKIAYEISQSPIEKPQDKEEEKPPIDDDFIIIDNKDSSNKKRKRNRKIKDRNRTKVKPHYLNKGKLYKKKKTKRRHRNDPL